MTGPTPTRRRERGSAIVEAAIATPVFVMMIFGVMEIGLLFRTDLTTTHSSRDGARAASVYGRSAESDFLVLQTVRHGADAIGADAIEAVVIYRLTDPAAGMDPSCLVASQPGICNRYVRADLDLALAYTNGNPTPHFGCGPAARDRFWCPADRVATLAGADLVGVYVETRHTYVTGFFGSDQTLSESTVIRIEPELAS